LPEVLVPRGIACLAFNRRGHDMATSLGDAADWRGLLPVALFNLPAKASRIIVWPATGSYPGDSRIQSSSAIVTAECWPLSIAPTIMGTHGRWC
jgi:hypothetical protein